MNIKGFYISGMKAAIFGILTNLVLFVFKLFAGVIGGSQAMIADAFHTASDILTSIVVLIGLKIAQKPADTHHPFGHGKAESIAAKIVSLILILAGLRILSGAVIVLLSGKIPVPGGIALIAAVVSIAVKEISYRYVITVGKNIGSVSLKADAYHHRSDAFSSIAALIGIAGARLYKPFLDPVAGIVVAGFIVKMGMEAFHAAYDELMDAAPPENIKKAILDCVHDVDDIKEIRDVKIRKNGIELFVEMTIGVDKDKSVEEGHMVTVLIKRYVIKTMPNVKDVIVHVEPA